MVREQELRELIERWQDKIEPVAGQEGYHQALAECMDDLEYLLEKDR
jgi:predicted RNA-binding protein with EMAP domain